MSLQRHSHSKQNKNRGSKPALSHIVKQWQAFIDQQKQETKNSHFDNYLQSIIPPINPSFSPKIKYIASHNIPPKTKEKQINKSKHFTRTKKKTLFIEDFDDRDIRNSAHSLEMSINKSAASYKNVKTITPERISIHKLPEAVHNEASRRHQSLPSQKKQDQSIMHNEYIKRILKKFQTPPQTQDQNCLSFVRSSVRPEFRRYSQAQSVKFEAKSAFAGKKYISPLSTKIRQKMQHKLNHSDVCHLKMTQKRSIEISPWQIPQQQS